MIELEQNQSDVLEQSVVTEQPKSLNNPNQRTFHDLNLSDDIQQSRTFYQDVM